MIYLLRYDRPLHHAPHYLGFTDDLEARTARHLTGFGSRLPAVFLNSEYRSTIAVCEMATGHSNAS
jgi:predicted GIY-YIG superfamily endonuclease